MHARAAALLPLLALHPGGPGADPSAPPLDLGRREHVEVQLVLVDVVVLDRRDRAVGGLAREDFDLLVDARPVEVATLDSGCAFEALEDPRGGEPRRAPATPRAGPPRKIVLAFDLYHLDSAPDAYRHARAVLDRAGGAGRDEHMVVALGERLRVEQEFTADGRAARRAIDRLERDVRVYGGNYGRLTEFRFFDRVERLLDLLEAVPGRKVVVLFSGRFRPDGFHHDVSYRRIAGMAARSRTAFYPVDTGGLRTPMGFREGDFGPPPELARLANETGGRVTFNTNDLSLGYARAERDLACTYTIGFHDREPRPDRHRQLRVFVRRAGIRVVHPEFYVIRSAEAERRARTKTALAAPGAFAPGGVAARLVPLRPLGPRKWEVLLVVEGPPPPEGAPAADERELRIEVRRPTGARVHAATARLPAAAGPVRRRERIELKPGTYRLAAVLSRAGASEPLAASSTIDLPPVPRERLFVVGPILGRDAAGVESEPPLDLATSFAGEADAEVVALTRACIVGGASSGAGPVLRHTLVRPDAAPVRRLEPVPLRLDGSDGTRCQTVVDRIPLEGLAAGTYAVRAEVEDGGVLVARERSELIVRTHGE